MFSPGELEHLYYLAMVSMGDQEPGPQELCLLVPDLTRELLSLTDTPHIILRNLRAPVRMEDLVLELEAMNPDLQAKRESPPPHPLYQPPSPVLV